MAGPHSIFGPAAFVVAPYARWPRPSRKRGHHLCGLPWAAAHRHAWCLGARIAMPGAWAPGLRSRSAPPLRLRRAPRVAEAVVGIITPGVINPYPFGVLSVDA